MSWVGPFFRCARQRPSTAEWELVGTLENGACRGRRSGNSTLDGYAEVIEINVQLHCMNVTLTYFDIIDGI